MRRLPTVFWPWNEFLKAWDHAVSLFARRTLHFFRTNAKSEDRKNQYAAACRFARGSPAAPGAMLSRIVCKDSEPAAPTAKA
jgi:hypothetical protein